MDSWVPFSPHINKQTLVFAGNDGDGTPMYVGRAHHNGELVPGKFLHGNKCHIPYNMQEIPKDNCEVLINANYEWKSACNGEVPPGAVVGGRTSSGETLYVGRAVHCGIRTPGKVHPSHRCAYIAFGWKEHSYPSYEVLVSNIAVCPPMQPQPPIAIFPPSYPPNCPPGSGFPPPHYPPGPPGHYPPGPPGHHRPGGRGHHHHNNHPHHKHF